MRGGKKIVNVTNRISISNEALVGYWISDRFPHVVRLVEGALRDEGFETGTHVDNHGNILTCISQNGSCGCVDVIKIMMDVATCSTGYDYKLSNPVYEASKMKHMIGDRVEAAKIIFEDRDNFIPKLQEMAKKTNIKFVIIDRMEDGDEKDPGIS